MRFGFGFGLGLTFKTCSGSPRNTGWAGVFGMRLSERSEFSMPPAHSSIAGYPYWFLYGRACWVSFLLVPFLWISKEKILAHKGRQSRQCASTRKLIKTKQPCASTIIKTTYWLTDEPFGCVKRPSSRKTAVA